MLTSDRPITGGSERFGSVAGMATRDPAEPARPVLPSIREVRRRIEVALDAQPDRPAADVAVEAVYPLIESLGQRAYFNWEAAVAARSDSDT